MKKSDLLFYKNNVIDYFNVRKYLISCIERILIKVYNEINNPLIFSKRVAKIREIYFSIEGCEGLISIQGYFIHKVGESETVVFETSYGYLTIGVIPIHVLIKIMDVIEENFCIKD